MRNHSGVTQRTNFIADVSLVKKKLALSIIDDFHHHVNPISPNITFTLELEDNNSLAFLDVCVNLTIHCKLWFTIYHKPTHTDRYQQFDSHHSLHHKLAVARPCITESTFTFKKHLNANLIMMISPRKHY